MGKVVFSGHGGFETSTNPPWVTVPSGTTIYFYSDNMKALLDSHGQTVETMAAALDSATPSQVVYSGQQCVNYTLYPPDGLDIQDSPDDVEQVLVSSAETLESLLNKYSGDIYWAACRVVDLDSVGGKYLGINESQNELGGSDSGTDTTDAMARFLQGFAGLDEADRIEAWNSLTQEQRQGARLVDESVRQWYVQHTAKGDGVLNDAEMDGFLQWWATASEADRNESWADLNEDQRDQIRQRYADSIPKQKKSLFGNK